MFRILFLDAYDSFTNNIVSLLTVELNALVDVLPIDAPLSRADFDRERCRYDAVVCGPGPGSPTVPQDIGLMRYVWEELEGGLAKDQGGLEKDGISDGSLEISRTENGRLSGTYVPAFGICLGFQSLVASVAGLSAIRRLAGGGLHGMVRSMDHAGRDIFTGVGSFRATLYHSLCAEVGQQAIAEADWKTVRWHPLAVSQEQLVPLAWHENRSETDSPERILMAVRHADKPFWGVQYHPESVCTEPEAHKILANWKEQVLRWNQTYRALEPNTETWTPCAFARPARTPSLLSQINAAYPAPACLQCPEPLRFTCHTIPLPEQVRVTDLVESLQQTAAEILLLDSANSNVVLPASSADVRGRFSILAVDTTSSSDRLTYHCGDPFVSFAQKGRSSSTTTHHQISLVGERYVNVWQVVADVVRQRKNALSAPLVHDHESPFVGGFMGFLTYELGLENLSIPLPTDRGHRRPDLKLVWVEKSIVVDHRERLIHIQHLTASPHGWAKETARYLAGATQKAVCRITRKESKSSYPPEEYCRITVPDSSFYADRVRQCQQYIAEGESYELCLTDQTTLEAIVPDATDVQKALDPRNQEQPCPQPWDLFCTLRARQPSPFASFHRVDGATLVSASPERFLQYTPDGRCSMRPMKGTVPKAQDGRGGGGVRTLAEAEALLHVPKEVAENLMIVDLVRHDLLGVCGPGRVEVPHLMKVEEYATVYQMITIVEGRLPQTADDRESRRTDQDAAWANDHDDVYYTGLDALVASYPPGSMTGAPKKRSCELLRGLEGHRERSLYSGVVGYTDIRGAGDWSVTIRSLWQWNGDTEGAEQGTTAQLTEQTVTKRTDHTDTETDTIGGGPSGKVWRIGAGGAVTALSTAEGETDEMLVKLAGPKGSFAAAVRDSQTSLLDAV